MAVGQHRWFVHPGDSRMNKQEAHNHLNGLFHGFLTSRCIYLVGELGIANHLVDGPLSVEELADRTDTRPDPLYRVLRHLSANGVFREEEGKTFALNSAGELLRTDVPGSYYPFAKFICDLDWRAAEDLMVALKDGKVPLEHHYGKPTFDYIMERPELVELFNDAMLGFSWPATQAITESYDFSKVQTFADIAGGNGDILIKVLEKHPTMHGVLFDLPEVVERTTATIQDAGLSDRCKLVAGDFFEAIPVSSDTYFMRHILHDWGDDECIKILKNIAEAAEPGTRLLIAECVIGNRNERSIGTSMDLLMLLALTGRERTAEEYGELLEAAGFKLTGAHKTASVVSVMEASLT